MPRPCPACGRPNAEPAARCLYCTAPLTEASSRAEPAATDGKQACSPPGKRYLIILVPQPGLDDEAIRRFAALMGRTFYDARLVLQTQRHRLLKWISTVEDAESTSNALREAGVAHCLIEEAAVEALPVVAVRRLKLCPRHLELEVGASAPLALAYPDVQLLVRGEIVREKHREREMATLRGASRSMTPGWRLHLYHVRAAVALEIDPEQFDWSVMGEERTASTAINLKWLIEEILARAPRAELDRGFDWEPTVVSRSPSDSEVEAMLSADPERRDGVMQDNLAQFRFYARWRFLAGLKAVRPPEAIRGDSCGGEV